MRKTSVINLFLVQQNEQLISQYRQNITVFYSEKPAHGFSVKDLKFANGAWPICWCRSYII